MGERIGLTKDSFFRFFNGNEEEEKAGMVTGQGVETGQVVGRPNFLPWPSPGLLVYTFDPALLGFLDAHSPVPPVRSTTGFNSRAPPPRPALHPGPRLADLLHTPFVPRAIEAPGCTFPGSTGAGEEWRLTTPRPAARCFTHSAPTGAYVLSLRLVAHFILLPFWAKFCFLFFILILSR